MIEKRVSVVYFNGIEKIVINFQEWKDKRSLNKLFFFILDNCSGGC